MYRKVMRSLHPAVLSSPPLFRHRISGTTGGETRGICYVEKEDPADHKSLSRTTVNLHSVRYCDCDGVFPLHYHRGRMGLAHPASHHRCRAKKISDHLLRWQQQGILMEKLLSFLSNRSCSFPSIHHLFCMNGCIHYCQRQ